MPPHETAPSTVVPANLNQHSRPQSSIGRTGDSLSPEAVRLPAALRLPAARSMLVAAMLLAACQSAPAQTIETVPAPAPLEQPPEQLPVPGATSTGSETSYAGTTPAPEFPPGLEWLNTDQPLTLEELHGKLVLLDFWTYGCINCMHNFPGLKQLEQEFANELVVIGVHSAKFEHEGETENIRQIILRYGLEHPVVNDNQFTVWNTWGVGAWPTLVLIDPLGNVVGGHSGEGVYAVFQPVMVSLIAEFDQRGLMDRTPLDLKLEREGLPSTVLSFPGKVLADPAQDRVFVADSGHNRIVQAALSSGRVLAVYGSGDAGLTNAEGIDARFNNPQGMALDRQSQVLYVADVDNHAVRAIDLESGTVSTIAGTGSQALQYPPASGQAPAVELSSPWDLALDGNLLYIAMAGSHQIWRLDLGSGRLEPFAGNGREGYLDGPPLSAELAQPSGLALGPDDRLYFADSEGSAIRWVDLSGEEVQVGTLIGSGRSLFDFGDLDGAGREARIQHPLGVASDGKSLYVADTYNSKIKLLDPESTQVATLWGGEPGWRDGTDPLFYEPGGLSLMDGQLYVADTNNHAIRVVDLAGGGTRTLVLSGIEAFTQNSGSGLANAVELPELAVAAGNVTVTLDVSVPAGYKFNDLAPTAVRWESEGEVLSAPQTSDLTVAGPNFPMSFEFEFSAGTGTLIADLSLYYCEAEKEELCLIDQVRLVQPLVVGDAGSVQIDLHYRIAQPELPGN